MADRCGRNVYGNRTGAGNARNHATSSTYWDRHHGTHCSNAPLARGRFRSGTEAVGYRHSVAALARYRPGLGSGSSAGPRARAVVPPEPRVRIRDRDRLRSRRTGGNAVFHYRERTGWSVRKAIAGTGPVGEVVRPARAGRRRKGTKSRILTLEKPPRGGRVIREPRGVHPGSLGSPLPEKDEDAARGNAAVGSRIVSKSCST